MRQVDTSLTHVVRALKAQPLHLPHGARPERLYVRIGAMDIRSFWKVSERENIPPAQSIIIVGDRRDVQLRAIELGVRALVITSNLPVDDDVIARAKERGTSLIVSPHDSATTAWVVRTASTIERTIERTFVPLHPDARISEVCGGGSRPTPPRPSSWWTTPGPCGASWPRATCSGPCRPASASSTTTR